eukprot:8801308-Karenia_brevis.AAC.1
MTLLLLDLPKVSHHRQAACLLHQNAFQLACMVADGEPKWPAKANKGHRKCMVTVGIEDGS